MSTRNKDVWELSYAELREEKSRLDQIAYLDQGQSNRLDIVEERLADISSESSTKQMF